MRGKNISAFLVALVVLSSFSALVTIVPENVRAAQLYVGGTGPGNYTTIQAAVDAAFPGDTIYVYNGTYSELITISKSLTLIGEDRDTTIIHGDGAGHVIYATSDWVNITGFTATNGGTGMGYHGMYFRFVENCTVTNNTILSNYAAGIDFMFAENITIDGNHISGNFEAGIRITGSNNTIINNTIRRNDGYGIWVVESTETVINNNTVARNYNTGIEILNTANTAISNNTVWGNEMGNGIRLWQSIRITISNNSVLSNWIDGVNLWFSDNNIISNNTVINPLRDGISSYYSNNNTIANNVLANSAKAIVLSDSNDSAVVNNTVTCNYCGISLSGSSQNAVYLNSLLNNTNQSFDDGTNRWYSGYPSGGNHWDDYNGTDIKSGPNQDLPGSDGIGDSPYNITGGANQDTYPIMDSLANEFFPPSEPTNLRSETGDMYVTIYWDPPLSDGGLTVYKYRVYRDGLPVAERGATQLWYFDWGLPNGMTFDYTVTALNCAGEGPGPTISATPTAMPSPPITLQGTLSGGNLENVTLTWFLSSDDGGGQNSVIGYRIYRNTSYEVGGFGYELVASVSNGTTEFSDNLAGEGDPNNYFYLVCAVDLNNQSACSNNQAGKFTRPLSMGMNLISAPLIQSNESTESILKTVSFDKVWSYYSLAVEWRSLVKSKPYDSDLMSMNHSMGFWIDVTQDSNLTVAGLVPTQTSIHLQAGWNLVGFPSFNLAYTIADLKAETGATRVEGFDASTPPYFLKALQDSDVLSAGRGYWIYVPGDTAWTVSNT